MVPQKGQEATSKHKSVQNGQEATNTHKPVTKCPENISEAGYILCVFLNARSIVNKTRFKFLC